MTPLVSIIVPAYNAEPYVIETINSALAQTLLRLEVIVVNDGSVDETLSLARSVRDPRVRVIDQPNLGAATARNRGLRESQGEYIQFLDADDLISPNKIEAQIRRLSEQPNCVATCRWGRFHSDPEKARFVPQHFWTDLDPIDWLVSCWEEHSMMATASWLIPRKQINRSGEWDESLKGCPNDDGEFFSRVLLGSDRVLFVDEAIAYYRSALSNSLSQQKSERALELVLLTLHLSTDRLLAREQSDRVRKACSRSLEEFVYGSYPSVPELRKQAWDRVLLLGGPYFSTANRPEDAGRCPRPRLANGVKTAFARRPIS